MILRFLIFITVIIPLYAEACVKWSQINWPVGAPINACVRIQSNACIDLDQDIQVDSLLIESSGKLRFLDGAPRTLNAHKIVVDGQFEVGTEQQAFNNIVNIELTDGAQCNVAYSIDEQGLASEEVNPDFNDYHPVNEINRTLLVRGQGQLDLHGMARASTWKFLRTPGIEVNSNRINIANAQDWQLNDELVIASTDFDMRNAEKVTINSILITQGLDQIQLTDNVNNTHWAGRVGTQCEGYPNVFERAEVGLLSHNINVYSPSPNEIVDAMCDDTGFAHEGAEIRIIRDGMDSPTARIEHIEMWNVGKYDQMGHYPIHFHELGPVAGSYVKGVSIRQSANRAIVIHGSQQILLQDNVVYQIRGHAYYLEPSGLYDTVHNTLKHNLGMEVYSCNPLDDEIASEGASVFYIQNGGNVFTENSAAGSDYAGFYYAPKTSDKDTQNDSLDNYLFCADEEIDYAVTDYVPLDEQYIDYAHASYDTQEYDIKGFRNVDTTVHCHGGFFKNISHSSFHGFWGHEHKNTLIRLLDYNAYKHDIHAVKTKNKGITEVLGLMAADNGNSVWMASHAFHTWFKPHGLLMDSHLVGLSQNNASFPRSSGNNTMYGVQVYEGRNHITKSFFESYIMMNSRNMTAIGRHQSFPFYSNDTDNSVELLEFDALSNRLYFENPDFAAAGHSTVTLHDLDGSLTSLADSWVVPNHDFIIAGQFNNLDPSTEYNVDWNAYVIDGNLDQYGQLLINWCDNSSPIICRDNNMPSSGWTQRGNGAGVLGLVRRLKITDITECPAMISCSDELLAKHPTEGLHRTLGGNVLVGHDYHVNFYDDNDLLEGTQLQDISAIEVHFRYAPDQAMIRVSVPVSAQPTMVKLYHGGEIELLEISLNSSALPPTNANEWYYDAVAQRVHLYLEQTDAESHSTVLIKF